MSEMVERVAKAIFQCERQMAGKDASGWEAFGAGSHTQDEAKAKARAAIAVMGEPTEAMEAAGDEEIPDNIGYANDATAVYRAMIDAALLYK